MSKWREKSCELTLVKYSIRLVIAEFWALIAKFQARASEYFPPSRPICVSVNTQKIYVNSVHSSHNYSKLDIDKCISIYTYSVLIEGHLVLCNSIKQKPLLWLVYLSLTVFISPEELLPRAPNAVRTIHFLSYDTQIFQYLPLDFDSHPPSHNQIKSTIGLN